MKLRTCLGVAALGAGSFFAGHAIQNGFENIGNQAALTFDYGTGEIPPLPQASTDRLQSQTGRQAVAAGISLLLGGLTLCQQHKITHRQIRVETDELLQDIADINLVSGLALLNVGLVNRMATIALYETPDFLHLPLPILTKTPVIASIPKSESIDKLPLNLREMVVPLSVHPRYRPQFDAEGPTMGPSSDPTGRTA